MAKIIIPLLLTTFLGTWTAYLGLKITSKISRKLQTVCYIVPCVLIVVLIKLAILYL